LRSMQALVTFALAWSTPTYVSRRAATAAALLALPTLPQRASALFGIGDNGPQGEFRELANTRSRLRELARQLESKELKGERDDDAVVVLQTLTIQFGGTTKLLAKTTDALPLLDTTELTRARELASRVAQELDNVRQGCRERSATAQLDGARAAGDTLDQYLAVYARQSADSSCRIRPPHADGPARACRRAHTHARCTPHPHACRTMLSCRRGMGWDAMRWEAMRRDVMRCDVLRCDVLRCDVLA
jgi:hypothetical protein